VTNKITIDLNLTGEQAAARGLDHVGDKAAGAGDDFQKMAKDAGFLDKRIGELRGEIDGLIKDFDKTGDKDVLKKIKIDQRELGDLDKLKKQITNVGDGMSRMARQSGSLDQRIKGLRGQIKGLLEEFDKTGNVHLLKKIDEGNKDLGVLQRLRKQLLDLGEEGGVRFGEALTKSLMALRGPAIAVLVGLAVESAPFLGAAISSAVLGGIGTGGIIGGVALAAQDSRVQDEAQKLGQHLSEAFQGAGEPFVAPTIQALQELRGVTDKVAADLKQGFASIAPVFLPLVRGITGLVETSMPGFLRGLEAAKPVIRAIANELPDIGQSISDFFDSISSESDAAVLGFIALSKIIQATVRGTGQFLAALSKTYEGALNFAAKIAPVLEALYGWIPGVGDAIRTGRQRIDEAMLGLAKAKDFGGDFAGTLDDIADSATEAKQKMAQLNDALDHFFGIAMNSEEATIAYERALDEMVDGLKEGKRTLDATNEVGRKHREEINATIKAIQEMHNARVDEGMAVQDSLAIRDRDLESLRKQLIQLGYNKDQINDIINLYKLMPDIAATTVEAPGAETTLEQLREIVHLVDVLKGGVTLGAIGGAKVGRRASGGPVVSGASYLVGENGPELLTMGGSGNVTNATQTAAMLSGASGGGMRPQVNMTWTPSGNAAWDALVQAIWPFVLKQVRVDGGDLTVFGAK
jgi:hypothetical protein